LVNSKIYRGIFPVAPTVFDASGRLDLDGQKRCVDFMIDAGSHGICILANFSEQFSLTDAERETGDCTPFSTMSPAGYPSSSPPPISARRSVPSAVARPRRQVPPW